jgi:hypothetical protein
MMGKLRKHEKFLYETLIPGLVIDDWGYVMHRRVHVTWKPVRREDSIIFFRQAAVRPILHEPSVLVVSPLA